MELNVASNYANVVNFIVFEVVLISLLFLLTTDVCSRLNFLSLVKGECKRLFVFSPPILGGGICSTSYARAAAVLFIRAFSVLLVLGTVLTIHGETKTRIRTHSALVRVPAPLGNTSRDEFRDAISNRTSCRVVHDGYIYHGLLYSTQSCEKDKRVLQDNIRFSTATEFVSTSLRDCKTKRKEKLTSGFFEDYLCANGVISCNFFENNQTHPNWCRGTLETETGQYICSSFKSRKNQNWTAECYRSFNLGLVKDYWLDSWKVSGAHMIDAIGAFSVLGQAEKSVRYVDTRNVTNVSKIFIVLLVTKIVLIVALSCASAVLRMKGAKRVIGDATGLAHLLHQNIGDKSGPSNPKIYLNFDKSGESAHFWASENRQSIENNSA